MANAQAFFQSQPVKILVTVLLGLLLLWAVVIIIGGLNNTGRIKSYQTGGVIFNGHKCQCYCSDKCGPRDMKPRIDRPFVDPETGICFCDQIDKANYVPNRCSPKEFSNSCCA